MGGSSTNGSGKLTSTGTELVLVGGQSGIAVIGQNTPLTRLNYFDGKFLRAEDMQAEQAYLRYLVALSNQGGGSGVVNGFDALLSSASDAVTIKQGLAFDAKGRALLLTVDKTMQLGDLVAQSLASSSGAVATAAEGAEFSDCIVVTEGGTTTATAAADLYLLTVGYLEALCGDEDVFGKLCEDACITSTDRRYRVEGVVFRAIPLVLQTQLPTSAIVPMLPKHYRSRVASAYFQDERLAVPSQISGAGVQSALWCGGAAALVGDDVPLAVFSRSGTVTNFFDAWTARRERIEPPNRRYWAWRMAMRPWDVFLAQIFQFQCQLHDVLGGIVTGGPGGDPCADKSRVLAEAGKLLEELGAWHERVASNMRVMRMDSGFAPLPSLEQMKKRILAVTSNSPTAGTSDRLLIDGGIVELPSAGYLPVTPGPDVTIDDQVRRYMGPGVDLKFCVTTPDYIPHALEEAQHMERISLLHGIDFPNEKPHVDVLVPNGTIVQQQDANGRYFQGTLQEFPHFRTNNGAIAENAEVVVVVGGNPNISQGAARSADFGQGGTAVYFAAVASDSTAVTGTFREALASAVAVGGTHDYLTPVARRAPARAMVQPESVRRLVSTLTHAANAATAADGTLPPVRGIWLEATVDKDPFSATGPIDRMNIHGRAINFRVRNNNGVTTLQLDDGQIDGQLIPRMAAGPDGLGGTTVTCDFYGTTRSWSTGDASYSTESLNAQVTLVRVTGTSGNTIKATIQQQGDLNGQAFTYSWNGSPLQGTFLALRDDGSKDLEIDLEESPGVAQPSDPFHQLAESSMTTIGANLPEAGWQTIAENELFPPQAPGTGTHVIGSLDWVLFHRRREKTCAGEVAPAPQPGRRFHVYWIDEAQLANFGLDGFENALRGNDAVISRLSFNSIGVISFPAGSSALDNGGAAGQDWKSASPAPGNVLLSASLALGGGLSDTSSTELGRISAYRDTLASIGEDVSQLRSPVLLNQVPTSLVSSDADGVLVLVTRQVANKVAVFRVNPSILEQLSSQAGLPYVRPETLGAIDKYGQLLGTVNFSGSTPDSQQLQAVDTKWLTFGDDAVWEITAVYKDASQTSQPLFDRTVAVEKGLGGDGSRSKNAIQTSNNLQAFNAADVVLFAVPALKTNVWVFNPASSQQVSPQPGNLATMIGTNPNGIPFSAPLGVWITDYGTQKLDESKQKIADAVAKVQFGSPGSLRTFWTDDAKAGGTGNVTRRSQSLATALPVPATAAMTTKTSDASDAPAFTQAPAAAFVIPISDIIFLTHEGGAATASAVVYRVKKSGEQDPLGTFKPGNLVSVTKKLQLKPLGTFAASGADAGPKLAEAWKVAGGGKPVAFRVFYREDLPGGADPKKLAQQLVSTLGGSPDGEAVRTKSTFDNPVFSGASLVIFLEDAAG